METKGFSLWLMPEGEQYKRFSGIISDLGKRYKGPRFEPHITLLGDIERGKEDVFNRANQLAQVVKPFNVKLDRTEYSNEYFKCVFARAEEEYEFMKAGDIARRFFYMESQKFMPHLSLLYGNYSEDIKKEIVSKLKINEEVPVNCLHVAETKGEPEEWKILRKIPFR
ncbi:TPA: hypothetical protein HA239_04190 [Candidatus Woesearchaeota archaeon]|nr:hypothetical protein QT06_C0001G0743 [archaeon GW2011_AR15]MBS3103474.1 hypothetical protein [Candidatus Woesearchaeota archaeon]HIH41592.1 hypothetical protein [Candidatus Woesearchaeota archaeon]